MPEHLSEYIIELADRFPDLSDDDVLQAATDYFAGALAYRRAIIALYARNI